MAEDFEPIDFHIHTVISPCALKHGREAELAAGAERRRATKTVETEDEAIAAEFRAEDEAEAAAAALMPNRQAQ